MGRFWLIFFGGAAAIVIDPCDVTFTSKIFSDEITGFDSKIFSDEIVGIESILCEAENE